NHLVGQRDLWSLPQFVSTATLIPRPDHECLVEQALARQPTPPSRNLDRRPRTGALAQAPASPPPDCGVPPVGVLPDAGA
ncbi:protein-(glutamine-N5) methyltransferase, release factor-specific, partial [Klebsiella pneumoniae]|nr:protein-(glutamine-N5) methyltransferase, release factor-specific [Klebsiella pneumoniae]